MFLCLLIFSTVELLIYLLKGTYRKVLKGAEKKTLIENKIYVYLQFHNFIRSFNTETINSYSQKHN